MATSTLTRVSIQLSKKLYFIKRSDQSGRWYNPIWPGNEYSSLIQSFVATGGPSVFEATLKTDVKLI